MGTKLLVLGCVTLLLLLVVGGCKGDGHDHSKMATAPLQAR